MDANINKHAFQYKMHCIVYILFLTCFIIKCCEPSGFKIESVRKAKNYEYPYIVRLQSRVVLLYEDRILSENNIHICTCVAVSPTWVLTAGHCIECAGPVNDDFNNLKIQTIIRYASIKVALVISSVFHPSYNDPILKIQSDIGLLRTEVIRLNKFATISSIDISALGGHTLSLAGYTNMSAYLKIEKKKISLDKSSLMLMKLLVVRYDEGYEPPPTKCVSRRCVLTSATGVCDVDAGGPLLHSSGVIGVSTMSLNNVQLCSELHKYGRFMDIVTWTKPHIKWINNYVGELVVTK